MHIKLHKISKFIHHLIKKHNYLHKTNNKLSMRAFASVALTGNRKKLQNLNNLTLFLIENLNLHLAPLTLYDLGEQISSV